MMSSRNQWRRDQRVKFTGVRSIRNQHDACQGGGGRVSAYLSQRSLLLASTLEQLLRTSAARVWGSLQMLDCSSRSSVQVETAEDSGHLSLLRATQTGQPSYSRTISVTSPSSPKPDLDKQLKKTRTPGHCKDQNVTVDDQVTEGNLTYRGDGNLFVAVFLTDFYLI